MIKAPKRKSGITEITREQFIAARGVGYKFEPAGLYQVLGPNYPERPKFLVMVGIKPNARPYICIPPVEFKGSK
jgi:hypothetical protein